MNILAEPRAVPRDYLQLIKQSATEIRPDDESNSGWFRNYSGNHALRVARDLAIVEKYARREDNIADFGAIPLLLTLPLKRLGYRVVGVDIKPSRFSNTIALTALDVVQCDIETEVLPFSTGSINVAIFNELFEHLRIDLIFTLSEIRRVLAKDGILMLSTPNLRSLRGLYNFLVNNKAFSCTANIYEEYSKLSTLGHMGHVREYTTAEVSEFLKKLGFRIETLIFRGSYGKLIDHTILRLAPGLRPFVSYIARPA